MSKQITWKLIEVEASKLVRNPDNPKKRDSRGFERLAKSLAKFGRVFDGIINTDYSIIDGHSRLDTAEENQIMRVFVPSRKLSRQEYKEMNAIYDMAKAGTVDEQILEDQFSDEFFTEWDIDKRQAPAEIDYSVLDDEDNSADLNNMAAGVKKAIQIEFNAEDYEEAYALVKFWRDEKKYVGKMIMEFLKTEKEKL